MAFICSGNLDRSASALRKMECGKNESVFEDEEGGQCRLIDCFEIIVYIIQHIFIPRLRLIRLHLDYEVQNYRSAYICMDIIFDNVNIIY